MYSSVRWYTDMSVKKCKGCVNREVGCHAHCQSYIEWKKKHNEAKKALKEWTEATRSMRKDDEDYGRIKAKENYDSDSLYGHDPY